MKLDDLEIGERGARPVREHEPLAERAARVRRALPERRVPTRCKHGRRRRHRAPVGEDADAAASGLPQLQDPHVLDEMDPRVFADAVGQHGGDRLAGLGAAGVDDAAHRMAALAAEVGVERDAELDQVGDSRRCLLGQHLDGARTAKTPPRPEGVGRVERGRVALPHRGSDAPQGLPAVRRVDCRLGKQHHVGLGGCRQRSCQARDTAPDYDRAVRSRLAVEGAAHRFYPHSR